MDMVEEIRMIFWLGGFNVRQFSSNCLSEIKKLPSSLVDERVKQKILGIIWDTRLDQIHFKLPAFKNTITKRNILATIASVYDPLGLIAPALLPAKLCQAELWKQNIGWDETVPSAVASEWNKIIHSWKDQDRFI